MSLSKMLKFRNLWIGAAMLWILLFHSGFRMDSRVFAAVKNMGYAGVDICLFASGIGCYFSLEKDPDLLRFLKRRIHRLGPVYYCFIVPWLFWKLRVSDLPVRAVLGNLLGIQSLVSWEYHFNWYIGGLVVFYLAMPYLKRLTDSCGSFRQDMVVLLGLFAASIPFWEAGNAIVILSRMPVLYAGVVFGKLAKQEHVLGKRTVWILGFLAAAGVAGFLYFQKAYPDRLWSWGLHWYPFALVVPGVCVMLSLLAEKIHGNSFLRWINRFLETAGIYSFELYLVHVFLYEGLMPGIMVRFSGIPHNLLWLGTIPVVLCGTYLLNRAAALAGGFLKKQSKKA